MNVIETEYVNCNLCGADSPRPWGHRDGVAIVECTQCGLIYSNPRPTPEELERYYSRQYFDDGEYQANRQRQPMYEIEIRRWLPLVGDRGRFLDVGCAMGKFLHTLPGTFEKHGVEFSEAAAEYGRKNFGLHVRTGQLSEVGIEENHYDVVQMRGVIEHLQDPLKEVRCVNKALRMNGWFLINMTPNVGSLSGRVYRDRFNQVFPREHLYYFNRHTLGALLRKCGLEPRHVYYPYWGTPYANPPKDVVCFVWNWATRKKSPPFWRNMMAVYSQKVRNL